MKIHFRSGLWLVALVTMACDFAFAKADTAKLSVAGAGIPEAIETNAPAAVAPSVWGGQFVDWKAVVKEPPAALPRYTVKFHVKLRRPESTRVAYVVSYVWDPDAARAYVYVPGPGDEWYGLNASSILRDGSDGREWRDGRWYYATEPWGLAIQQLLPNAGKVATR